MNVYRLLSSGLLSLCLHSVLSLSYVRCHGFYAVPSIDAAIWYCVATKHQHNDDLHEANLLKNISYKCTKQWFGFSVVSLHSPSYSSWFKNCRTLQLHYAMFRYTSGVSANLTKFFSPLPTELYTTDECDRSACSSSYTSGKTK